MDNRKMSNQHLINLLLMCDDELSREAGKRLQMADDALNQIHTNAWVDGYTIAGTTLFNMEYE